MFITECQLEFGPHPEIDIERCAMMLDIMHNGYGYSERVIIGRDEFGCDIYGYGDE